MKKKHFDNQGSGRTNLSQLVDRIPPQALEAEMACLGSMILNSSVVGDVGQVVRADEFFSSRHQMIFAALLHLYDQNIPVDLVQLGQRLTDQGVLEGVGGVEYLVEMAESVPTSASAVYYAKIVRDKALLRHLIESAHKILEDAFGSPAPAQEQVDLAEQSIFRLAEPLAKGEAAALGDLLQEVYERLEKAEGRQISGLETGFFDLDNLTCGLQAGEMVIVAGRPSMGKTALALNMAEHLAVVLKQPVAVFSMEMSRHQLAQRMICARAAIDAQKMRRNMLRGDEFASLSMAIGQIADAPLFIDDSPRLSIFQLRARARRLAIRHDVKAIFIDYLQLMANPGSENRQQEVTELSRGIKSLARELNVPIVCLSQLNRSPEAREGHRPRMSDLRESGSIEQDADVVMLIHREEYYHPDQDWKDAHPEKLNLAEVIVCKQRNGPTGEVSLHFDGRFTRFGNLASQPTPEGETQEAEYVQ